MKTRLHQNGGHAVGREWEKGMHIIRETFAELTRQNLRYFFVDDDVHLDSTVSGALKHPI